MPTFAPTKPTNNLKHKIMDKKIKTIYRVANKCGFDVKHREDSEKVVFAFRDNESELNCFFEVIAKNDENEKTFRDNVAHAVFLISEDFDPYTEAKKYLEKIGGNLKKYSETYYSMNDLAWKLRGFWLSL